MAELVPVTQPAIRSPSRTRAVATAVEAPAPAPQAVETAMAVSQPQPKPRPHRYIPAAHLHRSRCTTCTRRSIARVRAALRRSVSKPCDAAPGIPPRALPLAKSINTVVQLAPMMSRGHMSPTVGIGWLAASVDAWLFAGGRPVNRPKARLTPLGQGFASPSEAKGLCQSLKRSGANCFVRTVAGTPGADRFTLICRRFARNRSSHRLPTNAVRRSAGRDRHSDRDAHLDLQVISEREDSAKVPSISTPRLNRAGVHHDGEGAARAKRSAVSPSAQKFAIVELPPQAARAGFAASSRHPRHRTDRRSCRCLRCHRAAGKAGRQSALSPLGGAAKRRSNGRRGCA